VITVTERQRQTDGQTDGIQSRNRALRSIAWQKLTCATSSDSHGMHTFSSGNKLTSAFYNDL